MNKERLALKFVKFAIENIDGLDMLLGGSNYLQLSCNNIIVGLYADGLIRVNKFRIESNGELFVLAKNKHIETLENKHIEDEEEMFQEITELLEEK